MVEMIVLRSAKKPARGAEARRERVPGDNAASFAQSNQSNTPGNTRSLIREESRIIRLTSRF
jgi:hypothetical protein